MQANRGSRAPHPLALPLLLAAVLGVGAAGVAAADRVVGPGRYRCIRICGPRTAPCDQKLHGRISGTAASALPYYLSV